MMLDHFKKQLERTEPLIESEIQYALRMPGCRYTSEELHNRLGEHLLTYIVYKLVGDNEVATMYARFECEFVGKSIVEVLGAGFYYDGGGQVPVFRKH